MSPLPSLTIAVPTYNRAKTIRGLLEEIRNQALPGDELLVSDDGSTDETVETVKMIPEFRLIRQETNQGMVANWNTCLTSSSRDWICLVHDDDMLSPGGLDALRRACAGANQPALVTHRFCWANDTPRLRYQFSEPGRWAVLNCPTIPSGVAVHRAAVKELGLFNLKFKYSADLEYFPRICAKYPLLIVENPSIISWNVHGANYQFRTWVQPDFLEQLEDLYRTTYVHAGIQQPEADTLLQAKMDASLDYMFEAACSVNNRSLARRVGRLLLKRPGLSRRKRLKGLWGSATGAKLPSFWARRS